MDDPSGGRRQDVMLIGRKLCDAAAVFIFCLAGAWLACCGNAPRPRAEAPRAGETIETDVGMLTTKEGAVAEKAAEEGQPQESVKSEEADGDVEAQTPPADIPYCSYEEKTEVMKKVKKLAAEADPCATVNVSISETGEVKIEEYSMYEVHYCTSDEAGPEKIKEAMESGLSRDEADCLRGDVMTIEGKDRKQRQKLVNRVYKKCPGKKGASYWYSLIIDIDGEGRVSDVRLRKDEGKFPPEAIQCIKKALSGLVFPCLAGFQICPEYVGVE